jgi:hypothetical protein
MTVGILANDKRNPPGKRADTRRNVTFPARPDAVNGERRSFALLRPIANVQSQERLRDTILEAFVLYEEQLAPEGVAREWGLYSVVLPMRTHESSAAA